MFCFIIFTMIDKSYIEKQLNNDIDVLLFDRLASTNIKGKEIAKQIKKPTLVVAKEQTEGYGRFKRKFYSPKGCGLYFSLIIKPNFSTEFLPFLTPLCAVALCESIEQNSSSTPKIKWVNDIYLNGKKCCGILAESILNGNKVDSVVIGIGLNLYKPKEDFDDSIKDIACAIFESKTDNVENEIITSFLKRFFYYYNDIKNKEYVDKYISRSNIIGKEVKVYQGDKTFETKVIDIDNDCNLITQDSKGNRNKFNNGEISIKIK